MSELGDGSAARATTTMLREIQVAQTNMQNQQAESRAQKRTEAFGVALKQAEEVQRAEQAKRIHQLKEAQKANRELVKKTRDTQHLAQAPNNSAIGKTSAGEYTQLKSFLNHMLHSQDEVTKVLEKALSGEEFSSPQMIPMQKALYLYMQEMEYSIKLVDRMQTGVKQVINSDV